ncbi:MAG TPA: thioredoxin family protein [Pseudothermotoga sp.]|nr:thioredoxin family protein [Pseudothermotoga sp.]HOK84585.1 thioredoxin family protein [Pseudothermotoga sp.]HPP71090.1 thioredoxin family protein [Pseudothermotoga sp.]
MAKKIEILGMGCAKCKQTHKIMEMAVKELGIDAVVEKVEDLEQIINRGVSATPAVAIDGKLVLSGKIPTLEEAKRILSKN